MKPTVVAFCLLSLAGSAIAANWRVIPCSEAELAARAAHAEKVREASKGGPLYAPRPFPKTDDEVVLDLTATWTAIYGSRPTSRWYPLVEAMTRGTLKYDVIRVADWTPHACGGHGAGGDFYYLVIMRDRMSGAEVGRATVLSTGLCGHLDYRGAVPPSRALPDLGILKAKGIQAEDAQFINAEGSFSCTDLSPCIAARNRQGIYVLSSGLGGDDSVWLLPIGGRLRSIRELDRERVPAHLEGERSDQKHITLGRDVWVVAEKVK